MATACMPMREPTAEEDSSKRKVFLDPSMADGYLKASHFSIGQDNRLNENCLQTAYKYDYPPLPLEGRVPMIRHKASDKLLPGDRRYLPEQTMTETQAEYTKKPLEERPNIEMLKQRLGATHYKQHKDDRAPAWQSTHKLDFTPLPLAKPALAKATESGNLVFGDRSKAEQPISSYNNSYKDFSGDVVKPDMTRMARGPPTITGDLRANNYQTTMKEHYNPMGAIGGPQPKVVHQPVDMFGTRGKPFEGISEFREKYTEMKAERDQPSQHKSFTTTFRQDDGRGLDDWTTTHKESFVPQAPKGVEKVAKDSNKSNIPMGGKTPGEEMISNYQRNYLEWPTNARTLVNNDSELKYKSQVVFGDPALAADYFETTHTATYQPFSSTRPEKGNKQLQQSHLPLDNWNAEVNIPTYNDDFRYMPEGYGQREDRREMLERAQRSNLQFPVDGDLHWRTTHKSHFTPKRATSEKTFDKRRFQNSHISFGDQRINPFAKDCY